jgi:hypothetical protein
MIPPELQEIGILIEEQESWQACRQIDGTWLFDWSSEAEDGDGDEIVVVSRAVKREDAQHAPQLQAAGVQDG